MLSDSRLDPSTGSFSGIISNSTIIRILNFVESLFAPFINQIKVLNLDAEEDLTQQLSNLLNIQANKNRFPFCFDKEHKKKKRRVDIGVIEILSDLPNIDPNTGKLLDEDIIKVNSTYNTTPVFCIEAKRLPTPTKKRQEEYVSGNYGGIERFKKNQHAPGLEYSAILGYVQKNTFGHWFNQINTWIDNLISINPSEWNKDDKLINFSENNTRARSESQNLRIDGSVINLYHLWVILT